jgi:hypothetical protein
LLSEIGLNIREAHVFSTTDGLCLDVFVVDGWETEVNLQHVFTASFVLKHLWECTSCLLFLQGPDPKRQEIFALFRVPVGKECQLHVFYLSYCQQNKNFLAPS